MKGKNEALVGGLLLVSLVIGILGTIWLVRGGLGGGYPLYSTFRWGQNLKVGQPVVLSGVPIGYVGAVDLEEDGRLVVELAIESGRRVPSNARAVVEAVGIFGDAQVALQGTPSRTFYQEGDTVPAGVPSAGIAELTAKADSVASVAVSVSRSLQAELVDSGTLRDVRQMIGRTNVLVAQIGTIAAEQSRQLTATQAQVRQLLGAVDARKIDSTLSNVRQISLNASALTDSLRATTTQINALLARVQGGQGTAGRLLTDTLLYTDIRRLVTRVDSLTLDFQKNPGKYTRGVVRIF
jgi:phospholipid/cholesterol/gamma-HCH transport system substrate-binding protein